MLLQFGKPVINIVWQLY